MPGCLPPATVGRGTQSSGPARPRCCGLGSSLSRSEKVASVLADTDVPLCQSCAWSSVLVSPIGTLLMRCSCVRVVFTLAACTCSRRLPCCPRAIPHPAGPLGSEGCRIPPCLSDDGVLCPFVVWRSSTDGGLRHPSSRRSLPGAPLLRPSLGAGGWEI